MKRYAFIDVSNTLGTVKELLDFKIDWTRLIKHLTGEKWQCEKVFYYKGNKGTKKWDRDRKKLENIGYTVQTKLTFIHKDKTQSHVHKCECGKEETLLITTPGQRKSNCDVELSVDAIELAGPDTEFLIFTGDGDFAYLVERLIEKGVQVRIVSNTRRNKRNEKTFSSRLGNILDREGVGQKRVSFIDINDWKMAIMKDIKKPPSSVAVSELHP